VQPAALLEKDADAVYSGLVIGTADAKLAALSATTMVHGESVIIALVRPYGSARTFNGMLRDARTLIGELLAAEQGRSAAGRAGGSRWSLANYDPMLVAGAAGLMIGVIVLLVGAIFMRRD
jgi:hypothetical protein